MADPRKPDPAQSQEDAAESLEHEIDDLVAGRGRTGAPKSFREFIDEKMAEDRKGKPAAPAPSDSEAKASPKGKPKPPGGSE